MYLKKSSPRKEYKAEFKTIQIILLLCGNVSARLWSGGAWTYRHTNESCCVCQFSHAYVFILHSRDDQSLPLPQHHNVMRCIVYFYCLLSDAPENEKMNMRKIYFVRVQLVCK